MCFGAYAQDDATAQVDELAILEEWQAGGLRVRQGG
jgi:hypothetical protein